MGLDRCTFVRAGAQDLSPLVDGSVDVVTTRSVIIYVKPKERAFREFLRVLRPGGRLSMFEPINRFNQPRAPNVSYEGLDMSPVIDIYTKIRDFYAALQPRERDPMLDFDERDLLRFAEEVGFTRIDLEFQGHIDHKNLPGTDWDTEWRTAGDPCIPPLEEAVKQALTPDEAQQFVAWFRPRFETEPRSAQSARTYLWAVK